MDGWKKGVYNYFVFVLEQHTPPGKLQLLKGIRYASFAIEDGIDDERVFWQGDD